MPIQPQLPAAPINTPWIDPTTGSVSWQWRQWMNQFQQGMGYDSSAVAFGPDAQSQNDGVAVGQGSDTGNGTGNVVVGQGSTIANGANNCTIVGQGSSITAGLGSTTLIGRGVTSAGTANTGVGADVTLGSGGFNTVVGRLATTASGNTDFNVAVGDQASAIGGRCTAVGQVSATGTGSYNTAIGNNASTAIGGNSFNTCIGAASQARGGSSVTVGYGSGVTGARSVAIGVGNTINHDDCVIVGNSGTTDAAGQVLIGTAASFFTDIWFGRGTTHTGATQPARLRVANGTGSNVAGDDIALYGGAPTGNGVGGSILFYTAPAGGSGTTLRTHQNRVTIDGLGNVFLNSTTADLATTATDGFTYLPRCAGTPTGVPSYTGGGMDASVYDNTGDILYTYNSGWKAVGSHLKGDSATHTAQLKVEGASDTQKTYIGMFSSGAYWSAGGTYSGSWAADGTNAISAILLQANNADATIGFYTSDTNNATPTERVRIDKSGGVNILNTIVKYNNIVTAGLGVPAIYKSGRSTAQTAAVASVAAYTNGASDGSFIISANANVTTSTTHNFTVTVAYTDETNTARTLTLSFFALSGGAPISSITNVTGAGPYEGAPVHIRCKASTSITIATTGTFTSVTYNVEGYITQIG